jgi:hypothetical protein
MTERPQPTAGGAPLNRSVMRTAATATGDRKGGRMAAPTGSAEDLDAVRAVVDALNYSRHAGNCGRALKNAKSWLGHSSALSSCSIAFSFRILSSARVTLSCQQ